MPQKKLLDADKAAKTFDANLTPRYRALDALQAYVEGRQYAGLPHWFNEERPLLERGPCVVEPIVESALQSFGDFIFGEERFPGITSKVDEDDEAFDERFGLGPEDSITLDRIIKNIFAQAEVCEISREALAQAQGSRSAVGICSVKDGTLCVDLESAKCCTPAFDPKRPKVIVKLDIRYPYLEEYWDDQRNGWAQRCMLFRRVIDENQDVTFAPILAHEDGREPGAGEWKPQTTIDHNFGFCPVVWYAYRKICTTRRDVDGIAVHEKLLHEIDALNRSLSQRHRAGIMCGDPQVVETGVPNNWNPTSTGDAAEPMRSYVSDIGSAVETPAVRSQNEQWQLPGSGGGGQGGRMKGPGVVWRYESSTSKVDYLTIPAEAFKPIDEDAEQLRKLIAESLAWVRPDALHNRESGVKITNITAKALMWMYQRQTAECDSIRPDVWNGWLYPLIDTLLRIALAHATEKQRGALYLAGLDKLPKLLGKFNVDIASNFAEENAKPIKRWFRPVLKPLWGPYFKPTEADQKVVSDQVKQDLEGGIITKRTAVMTLAAFYKIDDIDAYLETLEKEIEERKQEELEQQVDEFSQISAVAHKHANANGAGAGSPKPKPPSGN